MSGRTSVSPEDRRRRRLANVELTPEQRAAAEGAATIARRPSIRRSWPATSTPIGGSTRPLAIPGSSRPESDRAEIGAWRRSAPVFCRRNRPILRVMTIAQTVPPGPATPWIRGHS